MLWSRCRVRASVSASAFSMTKIPIVSRPALTHWSHESGLPLLVGGFLSQSLRVNPALECRCLHGKIGLADGLAIAGSDAGSFGTVLATDG